MRYAALCDSLDFAERSHRYERIMEAHPTTFELGTWAKDRELQLSIIVTYFLNHTLRLWQPRLEEVHTAWVDVLLSIKDWYVFPPSRFDSSPGI